MLHRVPLLLALLLTLMAGGAAACSLAGPVPGPGFFRVEPVEGGDAFSVDVHRRMLGAMCELSNQHAYGDGWFVWIEWDHESRSPRDLHARDPSGALVAWPNVTDRQVNALSVEDGVAYWYERGYSNPNATDDHAFRRLDLASGQVEDVPVPRADYVGVAFDGATFVLVSRASVDRDAPRSLGVYDASAGTWWLLPRPLAELGLGPTANLRDASARWALMDSNQLLDLERREVFAFTPNDPWSSHLDGGWMYEMRHLGAGDGGAHFELTRRELPDGATEVVRERMHERLADVEDGHVVFGSYSAPRVPEPEWGARDQSWNPKGTGVPDLWVPRDAVQRETVRLQVIEFEAGRAAIEVRAPGGAVVHEAEATLSDQGSGHYGSVFWTVPRDLPPGDYEVRATGGGDSASVIMRVHEGPRIFASKHEDAALPRLMLEAVGFDAAPVTATVVQDGLRWAARWEDARGEPNMRGEAVTATVPGAEDPRRALGATDGSQSVIVQPWVVTPPRGLVTVWFNGTVDGEARSLAWTWEPAPRSWPAVVVPQDVTVDEPFEVIVAGLVGEVSLEVAGETVTRLARDGFLQVLLDPPGEGNWHLNVTGRGADSVERLMSQSLTVHPRPMVSGGHGGDVPAPPGMLVVAALVLVAAVLRRR